MSKRRRLDESRCGECEECLRDDCGLCRICSKMVKFGGHGDTDSECCIYRQCSNMQAATSATSNVQATPAATSGSGGSDDGATEVPFAEAEKPDSPSPPAEPKPSKKKSFAKKTSAIRTQVPTQMYGVSLSNKIVHDVCAGCLGEKDEKLKDEPIVLCDGPGCGREYHLRCCLPPLAQEDVPEGSYYCIDCDRYGTASQLAKYFEDVAETRADFDTSKAYVQSLFKKGSRVPVSELPRVQELHRDAVSTVRNMTGPTFSSDKPMKADFLIGKPIRLYCPQGNNYHSGRIVDWRRATHLKPNPTKEDFMYGELSPEFSTCEFLVTFPAGVDYRKRTVHQWIILEEHSLAVGISLVWTYHSWNKEWLPGTTWLRSSLEISPILNMCNEAEGQVHFDTSRIGKPGVKTWALTKVFGDDSHLLSLLKEEAVDFFSPFFAPRIAKQSDGPIDMAVALACTEWDEQCRIRQWYKMPLKDRFHPKFMTMVDESLQQPLAAKYKDEDIVVEMGPRPCPLIRQGLDRMWIIKLLEAQGEEKTKDLATTLSCRRVESRADAIQQLHEKCQEKSN